MIGSGSKEMRRDDLAADRQEGEASSPGVDAGTVSFL